VSDLGYKLDAKLYGHEIARDIQSISSNCEDMYCLIGEYMRQAPLLGFGVQLSSEHISRVCTLLKVK
jgi:hypothetical protein